MAKLPDADSLGPLPSARTGRDIVRLNIDSYGAPGRGLASIGKGLAGLGASLTQDEDKAEEQEVERRLLEFEQQQARDLEERRRSLSGDPSGFADQTREAYTEAGRGVFAQAREAGLSPRALERLARGMAMNREQFHTRAFVHELNQRGRYGEEWTSGRLAELNRDYLTAPDDAARDRILQDAERTIEFARRSYGVSPEAERRLRSGIEQMLENDALSRPDSYSALLELREGDRRVATPSTGEISEIGLARLEATARRPGMTPQQIREAETRLRSEAKELSKFIQSELNEGVSLTQAQHDALVGFGVVRGKDALQELMPLVNSEGPGREAALAEAMRSRGGLTSQEQPSLADEATAPGPIGPVEVRPVPGGRTPAGARPRQGNIEGIVLHHTAGTTLESALSQNQIARTGYNYYIDRDGTAYMFAPDDQRMNHIMPPGSNARIPGAWPHLSSENTIGISVVARNDGDMTDAQRNTLRSLTSQLASQYGIDPQNIIGHGDIQHTRERDEGSVSREFREGGRRVAQRGGTMTDASPAGADPRIEEFADLVQGRAPSSRFSRLPIDRQRVLMGRLEQALRPQLMADMDDDLELIRQTGQPRRLPDGTTSFSRAARVLTRNQFERYQLRLQEAQAQYRALHGLQDMTPEQIMQRRDEISRSPDRFGIMNRTRSMFDTAVQRMQELAERDPAQSVEGGISLPRVGTRQRQTIGPDGQPILSSEVDIDHRLAPAREIAEAHELVRRRFSGALSIGTDANGALTITPAQPEAAAQVRDAWKIIIDARMDAQARRGIPEHLRKPITRAEAQDLLRMPQRVTEEQFSNLLRAAVDRAYLRYGPYARRALTAAISFRSDLSNDQQGIVESMLRNVIDGQAIHPDELSRLNRALQLSREERAWMGDFEMEGVGSFRVPVGPQRVAEPPPPRGWFGMTPSVPVRSNVAAGTARVPDRRVEPVTPGLGVSWPKPTPQDIADLQRFPDLQSAFDMRFGPGAAAAVLQGQPPPRR